MSDKPADFATLKTQVLVLCEHIAALSETDHRSLRSIRTWSTELKTQIMALPDVSERFTWLVSGSVVTLLDWTRPLLDSLQVMVHLLNEPEIEPLALTSIQKTHVISAANAIRELDKTAVRLWHQLNNNETTYKASEKKEVLLHRDLPSLWVVLCYATRFNEFIFERPTFDLSEQSYVPLDLSTLYKLLRGVLVALSGSVGQKHHLTLSIHDTAEGVSLDFAVQALHMMPARWEKLFVQDEFSAHYAHLRELGGSIEPLTWDEGDGQGITVRMPWAT